MDKSFAIEADTAAALALDWAVRDLMRWLLGGILPAATPAEAAA
jgi:hypothetical protein